MKILVVDDDPLERTITTSLLRKRGHEVVDAPDGEVAWRVLQCEDVSLVVSDWMMPNLSGVDLCRRIRNAAVGRYIYVMLCTSRSEKTDLIAGMDAGADDFLVKPISAEELIVRVRAGERVLDLERRLEIRNRELERSNMELRAAGDLIEGDLKAAARVQENLLPPPSLKALGLACNWYFRPASYMGGDIFNFFALDERNVGFYLADVSGHGIPAAMFSVALSLLLTPNGTNASFLKRYKASTGKFEAARPSDVMSELNRHFQTPDDKHFALSYGVIDSESRVLHLAQAGNPNPILIRANGQLSTITNGGMPVGLWPEMDFDCAELDFLPGDRVVLYSDGISECKNASDDEFGDDRLLDYLASTVRAPLKEMMNGLEAELEGWHGSMNFDDDVSLLAVEMTGEKTR